jgi:hypothetical protein
VKLNRVSSGWICTVTMSWLARSRAPRHRPHAPAGHPAAICAVGFPSLAPHRPGGGRSHPQHLRALCRSSIRSCQIIQRCAEGVADRDLEPRRSLICAQRGQIDGFFPSALTSLPGLMFRARILRRCGYQRRAQKVSDGHHPVGEAEGHGGCAGTILALQTGDRLTQRFVRTSEVIIQSKPLRMVEQLLFGNQRPGPPRQSGNTLSESQIHPLRFHLEIVGGYLCDC